MEFFLLQPRLKDHVKLDAIQLISLFNQTFIEMFDTELIGGADEPLYRPMTKTESAKVIFREDYISSAFHEISHWVIAGNARRLLEDYGYWYEADGRDTNQQKAFEDVEIKPQAIELLFHFAANIPFRVSVDNLALPEYDATPFKIKVEKQVLNFLSSHSSDQLPPRALSFIRALAQNRGLSFNTQAQLYEWLSESVSH
ncbi:hypothetical protein MED121_00010 [Marinomonas sp. MED121]|nr:hypothetical protein MED121_00010 [Marinomonas sp. MED121]